MPMPAVLTQNGTGTSAIWTPDWLQLGFWVSFYFAPNSTGTSSLQVTYDNLDVSSALGGIQSYTPGNATWITVLPLTATAQTGALTDMVRGIQINMASSSATGACTATFIQSTFGR